MSRELIAVRKWPARRRGSTFKMYSVYQPSTRTGRDCPDSSGHQRTPQTFEPGRNGVREHRRTPRPSRNQLPKLRALVQFATALYAGLRRGELMALRWEDVDLACSTGSSCPARRQKLRRSSIPTSPELTPPRWSSWTHSEVDLFSFWAAQIGQIQPRL